MMQAALIVSAVGSSLTAGLLLGAVRWLYRIDRKTTRNHETLHDTDNGPGLQTKVREHRKALIRSGKIDHRHADD